MKFIFGLLLTLCIALTAFAQQETGWKQSALKGKVKSLKAQETYRYMKNGTFTEWAKTYARTYSFDNKGNYTEFQEFIADGSLSYKIQYLQKPKESTTELSYFNKELKPTTKTNWVFNNKGQKTEELSYNKEGLLSWRYTYTYDGKGNNSERLSYKPDGSLYSKTSFRYDAKGNMTYTLVETTGYANSSRKFVYDSKGNLIEEIWLDGNEDTDFRFVRTYDDKGNKIKEVKYKEAATQPMDTVTWRYEYDKFGNWTKRTESTSDGSDFHIEERVIAYW